MTETTRACAATAVGAVIGGMVGYMFFTDRGRVLRQQLEPALDDMVRELNSFRSTITKAAGVAGEGWRLLNEAAGPEPGVGSRYPTAQQTTPF